MDRLFFWVFSAVLAGLLASSKRRSFLGWTLLGLLSLMTGCVGAHPVPEIVERPLTILVPQTVEVPATVIVWQTVEIPVTVVSVHTVQVPMTVEVTRIVTVTAEATADHVPSRHLATAAPASTAPPAPTAAPSGLSASVASYLTTARSQNESLFIGLNAMQMFHNIPSYRSPNWNASAVDTLTNVGARVASVRGILTSTSPPAELARAHQLMIEACDWIDRAVSSGWKYESNLPALDRAYEANIEAERMLKDVAGE